MTPINDAVELGKDMAATIFKDLLKRLSDQGLFAVEIVILIEHAIDVIGNGRNFTVTSVNHDLKSFGWQGDLIDTTTFEFIVSFLKREIALMWRSAPFINLVKPPVEPVGY